LSIDWFSAGYELYIKLANNKLSSPLSPSIIPEGSVLEEEYPTLVIKKRKKEELEKVEIKFSFTLCRYDTHMKFTIPKAKFSLASAFAQLQMLQTKGEIKDYGVSQATLEQVTPSLSSSLPLPFSSLPFSLSSVLMGNRCLLSLQRLKKSKRGSNKHAQFVHSIYTIKKKNIYLLDAHHFSFVQ
jgi:hypothetical protein